MIGDLPLALEHACAYIELTAFSISEYIDLYNKYKLKVFEDIKPSAHYYYTVLTTWMISIDKINTEYPFALNILKIISFFASNDIPKNILIYKTWKLSTEKAQGLFMSPDEIMPIHNIDELEFNKALSTLRKHSLITINNSLVSIHKLVQLVTIKNLCEEDKKKWTNAAIYLITIFFPYHSDDSRYRRTCEQLIPHALSSIKHSEKYNVGLKQASHLLSQIALYFEQVADFSNAHNCIKKAVEIDKIAYDIKNTQVAARIRNYGMLLLREGKIDEAHKCFVEVENIKNSFIGIKEKISTDPSIMGEIKYYKGDYLGAIQKYHEALEQEIIFSGPNHPIVAELLSGIGATLKQMGDFPNAKKYLEIALYLKEMHYGNNHPKLAMDLTYISEVLNYLGDVFNAKRFCKQALNIVESEYGRDYPEIANIMNTLGIIYLSSNDYDKAQNYFEKALSIFEKFYGNNHTNVTMPIYNLAILWVFKYDRKKAIKYLKKTLSILQKNCGNKHPQTRVMKQRLKAIKKRDTYKFLRLISNDKNET